MTTTSGAATRIAVIVALATLLGAVAAGAYIDPNQSPIAQNPDSGGSGSSGSGGSTSGGGAGAPMPADDGEDGTYYGGAFLCRVEDPHQCHGAVGLGCDGLVPTEMWLGMSALALLTPLGTAVQAGALVESLYFGCPPTGCLINAGSWDHDTCCFSNPTGHWCGPENASSRSACVSAWDRAIHRTTHGLSWRRALDQCRIDTDGVVNFSEYCAPDGTIIASQDAAKCCGGRTRPYSLALDYSRLVFQPVVFDGSFTAVVCTSAAPPTPAPPVQQTPKPLGTLPAQPCTSSSQCGPGNVCYAGRCLAA